MDQRNIYYPQNPILNRNSLPPMNYFPNFTPNYIMPQYFFYGFQNYSSASNPSVTEVYSSQILTTEVKHSQQLKQQFSRPEEDEEEKKLKKKRLTGFQEEYQANIIKEQVKNEYRKKNTECNLVNQAFSFLCSEKSANIVEAFFKHQEAKVSQFYRLMTKVKQANKKYINRKYLEKLLRFQERTVFQRTFCKARCSSITLQQIRKLLRILLFRFMRQEVFICISTSSKIYKKTLFEHFWRRRVVMSFLYGEKRTKYQIQQ